MKRIIRAIQYLLLAVLATGCMNFLGDTIGPVIRDSVNWTMFAVIGIPLSGLLALYWTRVLSRFYEGGITISEFLKLFFYWFMGIASTLFLIYLFLSIFIIWLFGLNQPAP